MEYATVPPKYANENYFVYKISNNFKDTRFLLQDAVCIFSKQITDYNHKVLLMKIDNVEMVRMYHEHGDTIIITPYSNMFSYDDLLILDKNKDKIEILGILVHYMYDMK